MSLLDLPMHLLELLLAACDSSSRVQLMRTCRTLRRVGNSPQVWAECHILSPDEHALDFFRRPGMRPKTLSVGSVGSVGSGSIQTVLHALPGIRHLTVTTKATGTPCLLLPSFPHLIMLNVRAPTLTLLCKLQPMTALQHVDVHVHATDFLAKCAAFSRHLQRVRVRTAINIPRSAPLFHSLAVLDFLELDADEYAHPLQMCRRLGVPAAIKHAAIHTRQDLFFRRPLPGVRDLCIFVAMPATYVDLEFDCLVSVQRLVIDTDPALPSGLLTVRVANVPSLQALVGQDIHVAPGTSVELETKISP